MAEFALHSPAFTAEQALPTRFTADGANLSPPLEWGAPPSGCRQLLLLCEDPDAPRRVWTHWLLYGIPPGVRWIPEGIARVERVDGLGAQGRNDFGGLGYGGPAPPRGERHRYLFRLHALERAIPLPPGLSRHQLLEAVDHFVLARCELTASYARGR